MESYKLFKNFFKDSISEILTHKKIMPWLFYS